MAEHRERGATLRRRRAAALALAIALLAGCGRAPGPTPRAPHPASRAEPELALGPPPCLRIERIEVFKTRRLLRAHCLGGGVVEKTAALGRRRGAAKRAAGDERTPEGDYRVSGPPRASRFHLFLPLDYPSRADADRALADGRISKRDYRRIALAHHHGRHPPGDTPLGGEIGLHGEGRRWRGDSADLDWTLGCVALADDDIAYLAHRVEVGTPVRILP